MWPVDFGLETPMSLVRFVTATASSPASRPT
jgi:hypothetical protein